jgi:N-acetylneuraminate synthase
MTPFIEIAGRKIGEDYQPFFIAEIGINHGGDIDLAMDMIDDARKTDAQCVKFQCHIPEEEMIPSCPNYDTIKHCSFSEEQEMGLKVYAEAKGMVFLSTPFSFAAVDRLENMRVSAYKIGSGECNNGPLIEYIASKKKPVILSTGMNDVNSILNACAILDMNQVPYALLHCVSAYPTEYENMNLRRVTGLKALFPNVVVGYSDHTTSVYPALGAIALGASIIEKHFTSSLMIEGPDIPISANPLEFSEMVRLGNIIYRSLRGEHTEEEEKTRLFAFASVVSIKDIKRGEKITKNNIGVKRPGTGEIPANGLYGCYDKLAVCDIPKDAQLKRNYFA